MARKRPENTSSNGTIYPGHTPVARRSGVATARVYEALRAQILGGKLAPGTHLSQQKVATVMGTSHGPVISALRRLAQDGLLIHERGHGCRVRHWDGEDFEDLMTERRALETEAARLAARRAGLEDLERLRAIVSQMAGWVQQGRLADADAADAELHETIARLSRSPRLIEALARCHLLNLVHRRRTAAHDRLARSRTLVQDHQALVDAIASGDPDRAGKAMHAHLSNRRPPGSP
jgi:DNA-binding GntR family transcriptional regulator